MMHFKNWFNLVEYYDYLRINPEESMGTGFPTAFFYTEDHQLFSGAGWHEGLCNQMTPERLAKYGVQYCDDEREKIEKFALAGRVSNIDPYKLYPALARLRFKNLAKQNNTRNEYGDISYSAAKKEYIKKLAKHYNLPEDPNSIQWIKHPVASKHLLPDKQDMTNYMQDPTMQGKAGSVESWPEFEQNKQLLDKKLISFWNKNNEIYKTLLKPCLLALQNKGIIDENIENNYVSLPHEGIQLMAHYMGMAGSAAAPMSPSAISTEEELAAIHTGNLRGKHLSTDERNALRAKHGREIPVTGPSPEENYARWKNRVGD